MQWITAQVEIGGNKAAVKLAKEGRFLNNNTTSLVELDDTNAIAYYQF